MLKFEPITVWVDGVFKVSEVKPQEAAALQDELKQLYASKGNATLFYMIARDFFAKRIVEWKLDFDCNEQNKRDFYESYTEKCNVILEIAEELIASEREERLGNLLGGVDGT